MSSKKNRNPISKSVKIRKCLVRIFKILEWTATLLCTIILIFVLYDSLENYLKFQVMIPK
jgi:hypothetical protein